MIHRLLTAERSGSDRRGRRSAHAGARVLPKTNRMVPAKAGGITGQSSRESSWIALGLKAGARGSGLIFGVPWAARLRRINNLFR